MMKGTSETSGPAGEEPTAEQSEQSMKRVAQ
jgi:hypothetical protein